jgi:O-antigen/teichoic acid export membrane protein
VSDAGGSPGRLAVAVAAGAGFSAGRFLVGVATTLLTAVLVARALGPEAFGTYRLVLTLVWVLEAVSVLGFPSAVTRYVAELSATRGPAAARAVVRWFLAAATIVWAAGFVVLLLARGWVARFYRDEHLSGLLLLGGLTVLPGLWAGLFAAALQARGRFAALAGVAVVQSALVLGGTVVVLGVGGGVARLLALAVVANVAAAVLAAALVHRALGGCAAAVKGDGRAAARTPGGDDRLAPDVRRRMWRYAAALAAIGLVNGVLSERLEIFFLGRLWTPAEVGFYSLAVTLALHARRLGPGAIGEVLFPVMTRLQGLGDRWGLGHAWREATRYLAMVGAPLAVAGAALAEPLLLALFGPAYLAAAPAVAVMFSVAGVVSVALPAGAVILAREGQGFVLRASLALAALNVVADLALIPTYAALGAALANLLTQAAWLLAQVVVVRRWLGVAPPVADMARVALATLLAFAPLGALRARPAFGLLPDSLAGLALAAALYLPLLALLGALRGEDVARLRAAADRLPAAARWITGRGLALLDRLTSGSPRGRSRSPGRRPRSGRDAGADSGPDPVGARPASPPRSTPE